MVLKALILRCVCLSNREHMLANNSLRLVRISVVANGPQGVLRCVSLSKREHTPANNGLRLVRISVVADGPQGIFRCVCLSKREHILANNTPRFVIESATLQTVGKSAKAVVSATLTSSAVAPGTLKTTRV